MYIHMVMRQMVIQYSINVRTPKKGGGRQKNNKNKFGTNLRCTKTTLNIEKVSLIHNDIKLLRQYLHGPSIIDNGERQTLDKTVRIGVVEIHPTARRSCHSTFTSILIRFSMFGQSKDRGSSDSEE